jgi:RimJ/RimL family protein N-acetyltransferase
VINILPKYQRTHINTHAMSLILTFLFDELHLLRVQYEAVTWNEASQKSAIRLGFRPEGVLRNQLGIVPTSKRREGEKNRISQDSWVSSMTDYEWEERGRERLRLMMERPVVNTSMF